VIGMSYDPNIVVDNLSEKIVELNKIIEILWKDDPSYTNYFGDEKCFWCNEILDEVTGILNHDENCSWMKAKKLLGK
jgi:hypothetical protein